MAQKEHIVTRVRETKTPADEMVVIRGEWRPHYIIDIATIRALRSADNSTAADSEQALYDWHRNTIALGTARSADSGGEQEMSRVVRAPHIGTTSSVITDTQQGPTQKIRKQISPIPY